MPTALRPLRSRLALVALLSAAACGGPLPGDDTGEEDLSAGFNGSACLESPYNCKLREVGGNRVLAADGSESWAVSAGVPIRDGDGAVVGTSTRTSAPFNYGQTREFNGETYAFATSTSNGSAGWLPLSAVHARAALEQKVGHVSARGAGLANLGCYRVRDSHDPVLELKKVVYDSGQEHERAGDYLPLVRANGRRSVNLSFNVPGFALGGVAVDHFPAGTRFQRLDVPTRHGAPSIDIPLWIADSNGHYRKPGGSMKFIYGYVIARTGTRRVGWMAYDALEVSSGCP